MKAPLCAAGLTLALGLAGCLGGRACRPAAMADGGHSIYVVRRGWHTDLGLRAADLPAGLGRLREDFPGATSYAFGFGQQRFMLTADKTLGEAFAALFPGPALLLVTGLRAAPEAAFGAENVAEIDVTDAQLAATAAFVERAFRREAGGLRAYARGPYAGSLLYPATERYHGLRTCNTWTAETLRAGGLPVTTTGVVFAGQLWPQVRALATCTAAGCHPGNVPSSSPKARPP